MSAPFDLAETDRLLSTTRAVRKRLDLARPVPREVILDCIRLVAAGADRLQPQGWRWVVVTDAGEARGARRALPRGRRRSTSRWRAANCRGGDAQTQRVYDSAFWLIDHLHEVPVHVIPCVVGRLPEGARSARARRCYGSIFPAVWSFQLALRSRAASARC